MKRLLICLLAIILAAAPMQTAAEPSAGPDLSFASAALLMCADTGDVLIERNADEPVEVAGLKRLPALLTVCRAFDSGALTDETQVTVSSTAAGIRGVTAFLSPNEVISAGGLLKAAVMLGAGDAICALLETLYPSEAASLEAVNACLAQVGAASLEGSAMGGESLLSLRDLAKVCTALSESDSFLRFSSVYMDVLAHENAADTELVNPNRLVRHYSGCFGLATGSVGASQYSGAFIARRGSTTMLAIVAGAPDSASRFSAGSELLNYGFSAFRTVKLCEAGESICSVPVRGGNVNFVNAVTSAPLYALVPVADTKLVTEPEVPKVIDAPIEKGARIGRLTVKNASGEIIAEAGLFSSEAVEASGFGLTFIKVLTGWLHLPTD